MISFVVGFPHLFGCFQDHQTGARGKVVRNFLRSEAAGFGLLPTVLQWGTPRDPEPFEAFLTVPWASEMILIQ